MDKKYFTKLFFQKLKNTKNKIKRRLFWIISSRILMTLIGGDSDVGDIFILLN